MSDFGTYVSFPHGWTHEPSDSSVGILSDSMWHDACSDREHSGGCDLTGGKPVGLRRVGGIERFTEEWTCRDCGKVKTFHVDEYTGWDEPAERVVAS